MWMHGESVVNVKAISNTAENKSCVTKRLKMRQIYWNEAGVQFGFNFLSSVDYDAAC